MKRVLNFFLPHERRFFEMLASQAEVAKEASEEFSAFVLHFNGSSTEKRQKAAKKIKEIESEGDLITHEIIEGIHKSFVTPIDREDIHQLAVLIDDLIDIINEAAQFLLLYRLEEIPGEIGAMAKICGEMVEEVSMAVSELSDFRKAQERCIALHEIENKGDAAYHSIMAALFNNSNNETLHVMKLKDMYDKLEALLDKGEAVANVIENIVVKHA